MQTLDVVWFALLNAFIALEPMAARMRRAGDRVVVRVKKMKQCYGVFVCLCGCVWVCAHTLSDVLQDVKDELHHNGLVTPLAPPAVYDRNQHAIQGIEILRGEGLPIAPSHKSHLLRIKRDT